MSSVSAVAAVAVLCHGPMPDDVARGVVGSWWAREQQLPPAPGDTEEDPSCEQWITVMGVVGR
jgi:hypothetical protein